MSKAEQIFNAVSSEYAYTIPYYPYAFGVNCEARYWVETKPAYGQRIVRQLRTDSKDWFSPKHGEYFDIAIMTVVSDQSSLNYGHVLKVEINLRAMSIEHLIMLSTYYVFTPFQKDKIRQAMKALGYTHEPVWLSDDAVNTAINHAAKARKPKAPPQVSIGQVSLTTQAQTQIPVGQGPQQVMRHLNGFGQPGTLVWVNADGNDIAAPDSPVVATPKYRTEIKNDGEVNDADTSGMSAEEIARYRAIMGED